MNIIAFLLGLLRGFFRRVPILSMLRRDYNWPAFFRTMRLRLRSVFRKRFRWIFLLFLSVLLGALRASVWLQNQIVETDGNSMIRIILAALEYSAMLIFLYRNRRKPGLTALFLGTLLNGLVIVANGGMMPVGSFVENFGPAALEKIREAPHYFLAEGGEPLLFLADLIPFWSFGFYMISIGDLPIMAGIFRLAAYLPRRIVRNKPAQKPKPVD